MSWHLAPALVRYRDKVHSLYPKQDRTSDGTIGDKAHQGTVSKHNPNSRGSVNAIDEDEDYCHAPTCIVMAAMHPSVTAIIYEKVIYKKRNQWRREAYHGTNPHDKHWHTEIDNTVAAEQSTAWWGVTDWPEMNRGDTGRAVAECQMYLNIYGADLAVDGDYGDKTIAAVKAHQSKHSVKGGADGVVGINTEKSLKTLRWGGARQR